MPAKWFRKNGEAEAEDALILRDGSGRALTRRRQKNKNGGGRGLNNIHAWRRKRRR